MKLFEKSSCLLESVVVLFAYQSKAEYLDKQEGYYNSTKEGILSF